MRDHYWVPWDASRQGSCLRLPAGPHRVWGPPPGVSPCGDSPLSRERMEEAARGLGTAQPPHLEGCLPSLLGCFGQFLVWSKGWGTLSGNVASRDMFQSVFTFQCHPGSLSLERPLDISHPSVNPAIHPSVQQSPPPSIHPSLHPSIPGFVVLGLQEQCWVDGWT